MTLAQLIKRILLGITPADDGVTSDTLKGLKGRGVDSYVSRMVAWFEENSDIFPRQINVEDTDHLNDDGVDILIAELVTGARVGVQVKSDNDLRDKAFSKNTKAQITDARAWGLELLVIILACTPTKTNLNRWRHLHNSVAKSGDDILVISPQRAAGILRAFDEPMKYKVDRKSWEDFFVTCGQENMFATYMDRWPTLSPDIRYVAPAEEHLIANSLWSNFVTIVTGPPAVGKSFTAIQLMWRAFNSEQSVRWICATPTGVSDRSIPQLGSGGPVHLLAGIAARRMSLARSRPPIDPLEFTAANLTPNTLVFIEDPFGRTEDEFGHSLQSYKFFDIDQWLAHLSESATRSDTRILITSREGMFEKWIEQLPGKRLPKGVALVSIAKHSYKRDQLESLLRILATEKGVPNPAEVSSALSDHVELPLDAEVLLGDMPDGLTADGLEDWVRARNAQRTQELAQVLPPPIGRERLLVLLLVAQGMYGFGRNNILQQFKYLCAGHGTEEDQEQSLGDAVSKYRTYLSRYEVMFFGKRDGGFGFEPIHSTVLDAFGKFVRGFDPEWFSQVAKDVRRSIDDGSGGYTRKAIAVALLEYGQSIISAETVDVLLDVLLDGSKLGVVLPPHLVSQLPHFSQTQRGRFIEYFSERPFELAGICGWLAWSGIDDGDAWDLLRAQARTENLGAYSLMFPSSWDYLERNLRDAPEDLLERLGERAVSDPEQFVVGLTDVIVTNWSIVPRAWKVAFHLPVVTSNSEVQSFVLASLMRKWTVLEEELREFVDLQSRHSNPRVRAHVGSAALIFSDETHSGLEKFYNQALDDSDAMVPLLVMSDGLTDSTEAKSYADALYNVATPSMAAYMLYHLLERGVPDVGWLKDLAHKCVKKGAEHAKGVLAFRRISEDLQGPRLEFPGEEILGMSDAEKLGWLCAYANSQGQGLDTEAVKAVLNEMEEYYRLAALGRLSFEYHVLPEALQKHLDEIEASGGVEADQVREFASHRQPADANPRSSYGYPIHLFVNQT